VSTVWKIASSLSWFPAIFPDVGVDATITVIYYSPCLFIVSGLKGLGNKKGAAD
jgi:hypothetical protein